MISQGDRLGFTRWQDMLSNGRSVTNKNEIDETPTDEDARAYGSPALTENDRPEEHLLSLRSQRVIRGSSEDQDGANFKIFFGDKVGTNQHRVLSPFYSDYSINTYRLNWTIMWKILKVKCVVFL